MRLICGNHTTMNHLKLSNKQLYRRITSVLEYLDKPFPSLPYYNDIWYEYDSTRMNQLFERFVLEEFSFKIQEHYALLEMVEAHINDVSTGLCNSITNQVFCLWRARLTNLFTFNCHAMEWDGYTYFPVMDELLNATATATTFDRLVDIFIAFEIDSDLTDDDKEETTDDEEETSDDEEYDIAFEIGSDLTEDDEEETTDDKEYEVDTEKKYV